MSYGGSSVSVDYPKLREGDYYESHSDVALLGIDRKIECVEKNIRRVNSAIFIETSADDCVDDRRQFLTATDFYDEISKWDDEHRTEIRYVNSAIFVENPSTSEEDVRRSESGNPVTVTRSCVIDNIGYNARDCQGFRKENDARRVPKLKLSESLTSSTIYTPIDDGRKARSGSYDEWYAMKEVEKMKREQEAMRMREMEREEKQKRLVRQQEDFKRWLALKKQEEAKLKAEQELLAEKQKLVEKIREKKNEQSVIAYRNWLKMKEAQEKSRKQLEEERTRLEREESERRKRMNESAFKQWLRKAKATPRPVPLNRGIETLRGATSALYVNPSPWKENINVMEC